MSDSSGSSQNTSSGQSTSNSSSNPTVIDTPQADLSLLISQIANQLGQQQYQWASDQFAHNTGVTNDTINNYLAASQNAKDLAQNNLSRYENVYQPLENQLISDAQTYASPDRTRFEMGAAESGVGQSFDASRQNLEHQLQSYGIDPSSGRYAELERANDTARAAAQAGAGQAARYNTENVGRQLRQAAIQVGEQYPANIVNSLNSAYQGYAGAENALLANANTGVNMFNSAVPYFNTAQNMKMPLVGQTSQSKSQSTNQAQGTSQQQSQKQPSQQQQGGGNGNGSGAGTPNPFPWLGTGSGAGVVSNPFYQSGIGGGNGLDPVTGLLTEGAMGPYDQWNNSWMDPNNPSSFGNSWDYNSFPDGNVTPVGGGADFTYPDSSYTNDMQPGSGAFGGSDYQPSYPDSWGSSGDNGGYGGWDTGGFSDYGGGDYSFAGGGAIPDGTTGGFVSQSLSPSQGQQTDDVPARLNANEFVIPKDVTLWKGQEFFQNLIKKSREARVGAPAQAKPMPRMGVPA